MTQLQVSKLLHIDRSTYAKYELGKVPNISTLLAISEVFDVPCCVFIDLIKIDMGSDAPVTWNDIQDICIKTNNKITRIEDIKEWEW